MKIVPGVLAALVLSLAKAAQGKELMRTSVSESAKATVEKIADALCSVDSSPDLHYTVTLADKIYNCDEEGTGMIANVATTVVAESMVLAKQSHYRNALAARDTSEEEERKLAQKSPIKLENCDHENSITGTLILVFKRSCDIDCAVAVMDRAGIAEDSYNHLKSFNMITLYKFTEDQLSVLRNDDENVKYIECDSKFIVAPVVPFGISTNWW
jgi:hypothetical protein